MLQAASLSKTNMLLNLIKYSEPSLGKNVCIPYDTLGIWRKLAWY